MQQTLLTPVLGKTKRQQTPIEAGEIPVQCSSAKFIQRIGIDCNSVGAIHSDTPVEHRLVLPAFSAEIEIPALDRNRSAEDSYREQLGESSADMLPAPECRQISLGERVLLLCPRDCLGVAAVLQPAIRIGNRLTVQSGGFIRSTCCGVAGHAISPQVFPNRQEKFRALVLSRWYRNR